jgi:hypothetical protein
VIFYERVEPIELQMLRTITLDTDLIELLYLKAKEAMKTKPSKGEYTKKPTQPC